MLGFFSSNFPFNINVLFTAYPKEKHPSFKMFSIKKMYYQIIFLVSYNYYEYFLYLSIFPSSLYFPTAETKSNPFYRREIWNIIREPPRYSCGFSPPLGSISPGILFIFPKTISLNPLLSCSPPPPLS